jgi:hypothetical protein
MSYEYSYIVEEALGTGVLSAVLSGIPSGALGIASYVLTALALYTAAQRRGLNRPWLAWIPVVNCWILGSLSDQYQYVVKGKVRNKRKWLLGLNIAMAALYTVFVCVLIGTIVKLTGNAMDGFSEAKMEMMALRSMLSLLAGSVPVLVVSIAAKVIRYVALYDVYTSVDPRNNVMYIILSILLPVTEPFFLFFSRKKDDGMPPRREEPKAEEPVWEATKEEPWVNE